MKKNIILIFLFIILISCSSSQDKYYTTFDIPLMKESEDLRLSGDIKAVFKLNEKYYKKASQIGYDDGKAICYINLAFTNSTIGNQKQASMLLEKANDIIINSNDNTHKAILFNAYGNFSMFGIRMPKKAIEYNDKALYCIRNSKSVEMKSFYLPQIYRSRATIFDMTKQDDLALTYYHKARKLEGTSAISESSLADFHYNKGNMDSTAIYLNSAFKLIEKQKNRKIQLAYLYYVKGCYFSKKDYIKAEEAYKKALEINLAEKQTGYFIQLIYKALVDLYKENGQTQNEYYYFTQYNQAKEKEDEEIHESVNLATEKFISDIKRTDKEREQTIWIFFLVLIIIFTVVGFYIFKLLKYLKYKRKVLKSENELLKTKVYDKSFDEMIDLAKNNNPAFLAKFQLLYPDFINKLQLINPNLENTELIFCAMLKLNFTSKEIANYLIIQHKSVQQKKNRIRKKINLPSEADLYSFFNSL